MDAQRDIISAGTEERFLDGLYRRYQGMLCAYVRRTFGPGPPEPEDVAQAAFARFAALENMRDIPNPKAFLMVTARNLVIDAYRNAARGEVAKRDIGLFEENIHDPDASDVLSSKEELARLAAIVDTLKPKQRVAFLMSRVDGLSYAEIARRMKISEAGARLHVKTALEICVAKMRK